MAISLAMIVRNEAAVLARCLASVRDAVDEIVVVDTGSTDGTVEIARGLADRVLHIEWPGDFAAARNAAFDAARGEWVFWLDADDVVQGASRIRAAVAAAPSDLGGLRWRYLAGRDAWGQPRCLYWRERCVRHDGRFRWQGAIHEVLAPRHGATLANDPGVLVEHLPEPAAGAGKSRRNRDILEASLARARPGERPRLLFYLAAERAAAGETEAACDDLRAAIAEGGWEEERYQALLRLAALERERGAHAAARAADAAAAMLRPDWPEAQFGLAATAHAEGDWPEVLRRCEAGHALGLPDRLHFTDPTALRADWILLHASALHHLGRPREALGWTRRALAVAPDDPRHRHNFLFFATLLAEAPALEAQS